MLRVWIGGWRHVEQLDPTRAHTVYQVEVTTQGGRYYRVERRYSAFHALHKECRKYYPTREFPPKRIRNTSAKVLESRRAGLEHYIQGLVKVRPTPVQLTGFLELPSSLVEEQNTVGGVAATHAAVTGFTQDPYLNPPNRAKIPDILTQATLCAFYND